MIIVDGNNMLFVEERIRRLSIRGHYPEARAMLAETIRDYAERTRQPVTLTFDGTARPGEPTGRISRYMQIVFSGPVTADTLIANMLRRGLDPGGVAVVSSDREVKDASRRAGTQSVSTGQFTRMLGGCMPIFPAFDPADEDSLDRRFDALIRDRCV